jgi:hypothetical protein
MAPLLAEAIAAAGVTAPVVRCGTLDEAVPAARGLARPGDAVTLSPSCESFDQYRDYRHRAEHYQALVASLARETTPDAGRDDTKAAAKGSPGAGGPEGGGRSWT